MKGKRNGRTGAGAEREARRAGRGSLLGSAHAGTRCAGRICAACTEWEDFCRLGIKICCEILFTRCLCASWTQAASENRVGLHLPMGTERSDAPPRRDAKTQDFGLAHFKGQRFPSKNRAVGMPAAKTAAHLDGSRARQSARSTVPCPERGFGRQPPVAPGWFLIVPADPRCPSLLSQRGEGTRACLSRQARRRRSLLGRLGSAWVQLGATRWGCSAAALLSPPRHAGAAGGSRTPAQCQTWSSVRSNAPSVRVDVKSGERPELKRC